MASLKGDSKKADIPAVKGTNETKEVGVNAGIWGESTAGEGVHGETNSPVFAAVTGISLNPEGTGAGIYGEGKGKGVGVAGFADNAVGIYGESRGDFPGIKGFSHQSVGVWAQNGHPHHPALIAVGQNAGRFEGNVHVTGNLTADGDIFLTNADFAEDFDIVGKMCEAGTVMVLSQNGGLEESTKSYDKKVAGILSGAGSYKPGIVLDRHADKAGRMPLAMVGKVYCKVDADLAPIEVGDLLTTSDTPGYAMKASDPIRAFGTVIGKALQPLDSGKGMVAVLVSLQ